MPQLSELLAGVDQLRENYHDVSVNHVSCLVEKVQPNSLYVAADLPWTEGPRGIPGALAKGATAIVVDQEPYPSITEDVPVVLVRNAKTAYGLICANFFGNTHRKMSLYGVTGTKGKTTTCYLLESIFTKAGFKTGLIGTIVRRFNDEGTPGTLTTPEPFELHALLGEMHSSGVTHVVLEVSSIGIAEERIAGLEFAGLVFTNLGHEHLTYHGGRENYGATKARLFTEHARQQQKRPVCAINVDDEFGEQLAKIAAGEVITYGINGDVSGEALMLSKRGIEGEVCGVRVDSPLLGAHNGSNILAAIALTRKLGINPAAISDGVSQLTMVPGRLERVASEEGLDIFVDYAHTPESVLVVLLTLKRIFAGRRLIAVVGCGGYSDRAKRPLIAGIAFRSSDVCIITSDNPRHEDPKDIIADMLKGIPADDSELRTSPEIIVDRRQAIQRGVELLRNGGGVMAILGKGHERFQIVGTETFAFDDREVVAEILFETKQVITESVRHAAK